MRRILVVLAVLAISTPSVGATKNVLVERPLVSMLELKSFSFVTADWSPTSRYNDAAVSREAVGHLDSEDATTLGPHRLLHATANVIDGSEEEATTPEVWTEMS
jgi:hypothetical protein